MAIASSIFIYIFGVFLFLVCIYMSFRGLPVEGLVPSVCDCLGRTLGGGSTWRTSVSGVDLLWTLSCSGPFLSLSLGPGCQETNSPAILPFSHGALPHHSTKTTWSDDHGHNL